MRSRVPRQEVTFVVQDDKPVGLDGMQVTFDDERVVSDGGIALVATLGAAPGCRGAGRVRCGCAATGRARRTPGAR
jgi:hypothetical protein